MYKPLNQLQTNVKIKSDPNKQLTEQHSYFSSAYSSAFLAKQI